jgi:hypothetical protein
VEQRMDAVSPECVAPRRGVVPAAGHGQDRASVVEDSVGGDPGAAPLRRLQPETTTSANTG